MHNKNPKLLFFAWQFPPARAMASVRTWNIAKYLARLGWDVTVVTPNPSVWRHVDDPNKTIDDLKKEGIRRIITGHGWRCLDPNNLNCWNEGAGWFAGGICRRLVKRFGSDSAIGWVNAAQRACSHIELGSSDIILASGPPFSTFLLAQRLSKRLDLPYVLDYRDTWTVDPHSDQSAKASTIRKEANLLANSAAVTIVCDSWGSLLDRQYGLASKLKVITNGYDREDLATVKPHSFGHFAIVYAGSFYPPKRVISPVMAALGRIKTAAEANATEWYFHYFGQQPDHVRHEAERFGVMERVVFHGNVARSDVLAALRGAGVGIVITSILEGKSQEDEGIVPGKFFEIVGLGTPVLLIAPAEGDIHRIAETTALVHSFTGANIDGISNFLRHAINGNVPRGKSPEAYTWANVAKKLDSVLREAVKRKTVPSYIENRSRRHIAPFA